MSLLSQILLLTDSFPRVPRSEYFSFFDHCLTKGFFFRHVILVGLSTTCVYRIYKPKMSVTTYPVTFLWVLSLLKIHVLWTFPCLQ